MKWVHFSEQQEEERQFNSRMTEDRGEGWEPLSTEWLIKRLLKQWEMSWDLIGEKGPAALRSGGGRPRQRNCRCKAIGGSRFFNQEESVAKLIGRRVWGLIWKLRLQSKHILFAYVVCCVLLLWVVWGRVVEIFMEGGRAPLSTARVTPAH